MLAGTHTTVYNFGIYNPVVNTVNIAASLRPGKNNESDRQKAAASIINLSNHMCGAIVKCRNFCCKFRRVKTSQTLTDQQF